MAIPIQDARGIFTKSLIATWNELTELAPKGFLRSFFTKKTALSKEISIEVMRGTEKIAVDVQRGSEGNRNSFSKSAEKIFVPPYFKEWFDATELDNYDRLFGQDTSNVNARIITGMIDQAVEKLAILRYKIERAYELQCSQVFKDGIVQLVSGDNIDFKRKALSMPAKDPADYWTVSTVNPLAHLQTGATWLRQVGKAGAAEFDVICGSSALTALLNNPFVKHEKLTVLSLTDIKTPQVGAQGGVYHGTLSAGPYKMHIWSYPEFYDNAAGVSTPYINDDYVYMIPRNSTALIMSFASVPAIIRDPQNAEFPAFIRQMEGDYFINNYIDPKGEKHVFDIKSAGLALPLTVDRLYSMKVTGVDNPAN